jgi:DNA-binding Xre family transcriptional regulator
MFRFLVFCDPELGHMLTIKLRDAMEAYRRRTGERMTYRKLAALTGISDSSLRKIGGSLTHHTTLANIEKLCRTLDVTPGDLLELIDDPPKPKKKRSAASKRAN